MKAIVVDRSVIPEQLKIKSIPIPRPGSSQLLIAVKAAGVNRADLLQRKGLYPPPPGESDLLGLEIAGRVAKTGTGCDSWKAGDSVFGLIGGGGYAEFALLHQNMAMKIPGNLSFEEAAAIPEAFLTAFQSLHWSGSLVQDQWVLIHAGASGVGTAAIQLARIAGANVIVTAGSDKKIAACLQLGAHRGIIYKKEEFLPAVMALTREKGVNLILDFAGKSFWQQNLEALATDGKIVFLATLGGSIINQFDIRQVMRKRLTLIGSTLRNRSRDYKIKLTAEFTELALPHFVNGDLKPVIDKIFSWTDAEQAHKYIEENRNIGKVVLRISSQD